MRRVGLFVLPLFLLTLAGIAALVIAGRKPPAGQLDALREMLRSVEAVQKDMQKDEQRLELYHQYRDARRQVGEGFWDHVTLAMQLHVRNVADHNALLQAAVRAPLVPAALAPPSPLSRFTWASGPLAADLNRAVAYWLEVDHFAQQMDAIQGRRDWQEAKRLNQLLCEYWDKVLLEDAGSASTRSMNETMERLRAFLKKQT